VPNRNSPSFDSKLDAILRRSAEVFCARGYHRASIRDISRATGVSLAGLYYYFSSKEQLLYLIQRHAFETLLEQARAGLGSIHAPEERLRRFVELHLSFFIEHPNEMKVLTHEEAALGDEWSREIHTIKKNYYRLGYGLVEALRGRHRLGRGPTRLAVLSLFGMMNWIYTWYNPRVDPDARSMAQTMADIFLRGMVGAGRGRARTNGAARAAGSSNGSPRKKHAVARQAANGSAHRNARRVQV
jgi:AcrR family transcriptional regulator